MVRMDALRTSPDLLRDNNENMYNIIHEYNSNIIPSLSLHRSQQQSKLNLCCSCARRAVRWAYFDLWMCDFYTGGSCG